MEEKARRAEEDAHAREEEDSAREASDSMAAERSSENEGDDESEGVGVVTLEDVGGHGGHGGHGEGHGEG